jgi:hypothetical protein
MIGKDQLMHTGSKSFPVEPLRAKLSDADGRIRLNHWMPSQQGIAPRLRIGRRWINTLWGMPIAAAALLCLIAVALSLRELRGMRHTLTIFAYEMNGAPLRLRCENELSFKMVKWIAAIEFVRDFAALGAGHGGYNEDHEFYGYRMPI